MNRVLFTSIICSVACNELPSDSQLLGSDSLSEETLMMIEGSVEQQSEKQTVKSNPKALSVPSIFNDHSKSLHVSNSAIDADLYMESYFESDNAFAKQLYNLSEALDLTNVELVELIDLEAQMQCEVMNVIIGEIQLEDNLQRGVFGIDVFGFENDEQIDAVRGKVYLGKSTGIMMDSDNAMIASLESTGSATDWELAHGVGEWKDDDTKGERFFLILDNDQLVGFETECE